MMTDEEFLNTIGKEIKELVAYLMETNQTVSFTPTDKTKQLAPNMFLIEYDDAKEETNLR